MELEAASERVSVTCPPSEWAMSLPNVAVTKDKAIDVINNVAGVEGVALLSTPINPIALDSEMTSTTAVTSSSSSSSSNAPSNTRTTSTSKMESGCRSSGGWFSCDQCGKTFKELRTLRLHLKIHSSEFPERCETCGKAFRTKWQLKQHRMDHEGGARPYPCPECSFTCKTKQQLSEHRRKHSGEKAYACQLCGTRFTYRNGLIKHTKLNRCPKKVVLPDGAAVFRKRNVKNNINGINVSGNGNVGAGNSVLNNGATCTAINKTDNRGNETREPRVFNWDQVPTEATSTSSPSEEAQHRTVTSVNELSCASGLPLGNVEPWAAHLPPGSLIRITKQIAEPLDNHQWETRHKETLVLRTAYNPVENNNNSNGSNNNSGNGNGATVEPSRHTLYQTLPSYSETFGLDATEALLTPDNRIIDSSSSSSSRTAFECEQGLQSLVYHTLEPIVATTTNHYSRQRSATHSSSGSVSGDSTLSLADVESIQCICEQLVREEREMMENFAATPPT